MDLDFQQATTEPDLPTGSGLPAALRRLRAQQLPDATSMVVTRRELQWLQVVRQALQDAPVLVPDPV
jgi:hypothetical protein